MSDNPFKITAACHSTKARLAQLDTIHGKVQTPIFLPVGTRATVRSLTPRDLEEIGIQMILCNAYHLYLRPGVEIIKKSGGLHEFMRWNRPILTDSGGYQIFSLPSFSKISDEGVSFRSHIDGSEHFLTPENAISMQEEFGADVIMALDICPESTGKKENLTRAVSYTSAWAERCKKAHQNTGQHLFGIVQGGTHRDLRKLSAQQITGLDFPGYAIGGLSLGETKSIMWDIVEYTIEFLPVDKPRYLMGVGSPEDIVEGIERGIDIYDSALPTRVARNGALYTREGRINIKRSYFSEQIKPVDEWCKCYTCQNFTRAYMHHLFKCEELLAYRLATIHNIYFMNSIIEEIHHSIKEDRFKEFKVKFLDSYRTTDEDRRIEQKLRNVDSKKRKVLIDF